jgi:lysophospholipase L1-like esterase
MSLKEPEIKTLSNKIGDLSGNGITESDLSTAIKNDRSQLADVANNNSINTSYIKCSYIASFVRKLLTNNAKYAILGDSITDAGNVTQGITGGASSPSKGYASVLRDLVQAKYGTGITFDNRGVGGQTVAQAMARVDTQIIPNNYDLVVIELGTNDWNYGTPLNDFDNNYRKLVEKLLNNTNADIILIGLGYFKDHVGASTLNGVRETAYNYIIQKIAYDYNLGYIDTYSAMKNSIYDWSLITYAPDPVHPNDLGHQLWANECFTWLNFNGTLVQPIIKDIRTVLSCTSNLISWYGGWSNKGTFPTPFGDGVLYGTNNIGDFFIYKFRGNRIDLRFYKDTVCGKVDIYVDDVLTFADVDLYSANYNYIPIVLKNLTNRTHLLKVVVKTKNASATDNQVSLNQIITYDNGLDTTDSKTFYAPSDLNLNGFTIKSDSSAYSGNLANYDGANNLRVSLYKMVYGSKIKLIYVMYNLYGIYDVYIDRVKVDTIDFYSSSGIYGNTKEYSVTLGWHLVEIISTQTKNGSSSNYVANIEGILVYNDESDFISSGVGGNTINLGYNFYEAPKVQITPTSNCTCYISSKTEKQIVVTTNPTGSNFDIFAKGY